MQNSIIPVEFIDRFITKFLLDNSGCWIWQACISPNGYGGFTWPGRRRIGAHRASYLIYKGKIPSGLCVLHDCDVKSCVNPAHLHLGTRLDNMREAVDRGRIAKGDRHSSRTHPERLPRGEGNGYSKLTEDKVREIRARYAMGGVFQRTLAEEFCVNQTAIGDIVRRETWDHI